MLLFPAQQPPGSPALSRTPANAPLQEHVMHLEATVLCAPARPFVKEFQCCVRCTDTGADKLMDNVRAPQLSTVCTGPIPEQCASKTLGDLMHSC